MTDCFWMVILGIEFEPLNTPLKKRLETLAAATYVATFILGGPAGLVLAIYSIFYTQFWWLSLLYLTWIWVFDREAGEKEDSYRNEWVRNLIWFKYVANYFPIKLIRLPEVHLDPKRNYLLVCSPHGMISTGVFITFATNTVGCKEVFPQHRPHLCTLAQTFYMPFFRWLGLSMGVRSSSAKSINHLLSKEEGGHMLALIVGGAAESYHCKPGQYKLVLKNRKGFVKLALQNGSPLVPVITFGETDLYTQAEGETLRICQEYLRKFIGCAPVIPLGRGLFQKTFGLVPHRRPLHVVVGKPIDVQKTENPSQEQIEALHRIFIEQLTETFESQKKLYIKDYENIHLEIV